MPYRNRDFAVAVTCIDGRTHEPVTRWARQHAGVHYVDLVTEPGPDATLAECGADGAGDRELADGCPAILRRLRVSLAAHAPEMVVIAGHDDCAANPVDPHVHREHIVDAVHEVAGWDLGVPVVGVWIDDFGNVEQITAN